MFLVHLLMAVIEGSGGVGSQSVMEKLQAALLGKSGTGAGDTKDTMFLVHLLMAVIEASGGVDALFGGGGAQVMPTTPALPAAPSVGKKTGVSQKKTGVS